MFAQSSRSFLAVLCAILFMALFLSGCGTKGLKPSQSGQEISPDLGNKVTQTAIRQSGTRYKWGGDTPRGFDCSGLVWWSYKQYGIKVPRVTQDQASFGRKVNLKQARPGDILIFQISSGLHTALYAGKGEFVHSPASGKHVRKDKVNTKYWRSRLKGVRRVTI